MPVEPSVRIGELSRRIGVSADVLRAWEQRYGALRPARAPNGYRLYTRDDERRARRMKELIAAGHSASEAAKSVTSGQLDPTPVPPAPSGGLPEARVRLLRALLDMDATRAHGRLDQVMETHTVDVLLRDVVLPVLHQLGDGWASGRVSVAQEHFASELLGGRLRSLGRGWDEGLGPRVLLACPSGERHDLGLLCCALALGRRGWRVVYLGADTPTSALEDAIVRVQPDLTVLSSVTPGPLAAVADALGRLSARSAIALGGAGASPSTALRSGAQLLREDPVTAARELTTMQAG